MPSRMSCIRAASPPRLWGDQVSHYCIHGVCSDRVYFICVQTYGREDGLNVANKASNLKKDTGMRPLDSRPHNSCAQAAPVPERSTIIQGYLPIRAFAALAAGSVDFGEEIPKCMSYHICRHSITLSQGSVVRAGERASVRGSIQITTANIQWASTNHCACSTGVAQYCTGLPDSGRRSLGNGGSKYIQ